jgi:hypothetical protein
LPEGEIKITLHQHCWDRRSERGAEEAEVLAAVETGERFPAKFGRTGFRRNFPFGGTWRGRRFHPRQVEAYPVPENDGWLVITVIVRYF